MHALKALAAGALATGLCLPSLSAQSYRDFMLVRNRPQPFRDLLQFRAGAKGSIAEDENAAFGREDDIVPDGFVYWHTKNLAQGSKWLMDFYLGQDGGYLGFKDEMRMGKQTQTRLELFGRPRAFYREGYYQGDDYLVTGSYETSDYGASISYAQQVDKGLMLDFSTFYRRYEFDRTDLTRSDFLEPDDHHGYGVAVSLEQNTLVLDKILGMPRQGMLLTVRLENERNGSDRTFGFSGGYTSRLPSGFWRGEVAGEFYVPSGRDSAWVITFDGGYYDDKDRVHSYRAERVQGHQWVDATLGYRMAFSQSLVLRPYVQGQYTKVLELDGVGSDQEFFFGGGLDLGWNFSENLALVARYSYVDNPSRPSISMEEDIYGEHQFFVGMDVLFGSGFRN